MKDDGHIDCFNSHKDVQRQRVGNQLFNEIEKEARKRNLVKLTVEISVTAKSFFVIRDQSVDTELVVTTTGIKFTNFLMAKKTTARWAKLHLFIHIQDFIRFMMQYIVCQFDFSFH